MKRQGIIAEAPHIPDIQGVEVPTLTNEEATQLSYENALLGILTRIEKMLVAEQGQSPEFRVWEFELAASGRKTVEFDIRPDKWVVWTRKPITATDTLRIALGADVPGLNAVEIIGGYVAELPGMTSQIAFHNQSSANVLHVFVVAVSVGDFSILQTMV